MKPPSQVYAIALKILNTIVLTFLNTIIKDVTKAIDEFHFNIAVAQIRSLFNFVSSYKIENDNDKQVVLFVTSKLLILINPMDERTPRNKRGVLDILFRNFYGMKCQNSVHHL